MEIRGYFELEARELSERLGSGAARLLNEARTGAAPADEALLRSLARAAHTLKGAAHVVEETEIAALAHGFEDALAAHRAAASGHTADALVAVADRIAAALAADSTPAQTPAAPASLQAAPAPDTHAASVPAPGTARDDAQPSRGKYDAGEPVAPPARPELQTIRVSLEDTADLLRHIDAGTYQLSLLRGTVAAELPGGPQRDALERSMDRLERELDEMHRLGQRLRLLPVEGLLLEAARTARATAARLGLAVEVVTAGGGERVGLQLAEALQDSLLHLVRNSFAHGFEPATERVRLGKPAAGTLRIAVTRAGTTLEVTCADDGRGIALEPLRAAAIARQGWTEARAAGSQPAELYALLLEPGFSTRATADDLSGRGVGLDAVRTAMERVGGTVLIHSEPGHGTAFTLRAPESTVAMALLEVQAGGCRYALPAAAVEQTFPLGTHPFQFGRGKPAVRIGTETMPYVVLQQLLPGSSAAPASARGAGVVLRSVHDGIVGRLALGVDALGEQAQHLVQALPAVAQVEPIVQGIAFDAQGRMLQVLDPSQLMGRLPRMAAPSGAPTAAVRPILVIDDSLTTRMLEQSILENEGYEVDLAVSAEQGLEKARARHYALFLVDVEMPGMSGFDFVRLTRADPVLARTPAILVTSLNAAEDRERGHAAGAAGYVVKGEFNQGIYLERIRTLAGAPAPRPRRAEARA